VIIGSCARGDATNASDMDVLFLCPSSRPIAPLYRLIRQRELSHPLSLITYGPSDFARFWREGSLFVYHVITEGAMVSDDGTLARLLKRGFRLKTNFHVDILDQLQRLELFRDPRPFQDYFISVFARLFSIYKNVVFFALAERGHPEFNKKRAFDRFYHM